MLEIIHYINRRGMKFIKVKTVPFTFILFIGKYMQTTTTELLPYRHDITTKEQFEEFLKNFFRNNNKELYIKFMIEKGGKA